MKQLIQAVKGTRDFYPEDMAFRNWLYGKIKKVSEKFGYQEFDGPYIEYLDLYKDKTSEEILKDQAFSLKDRDGRDILLRPEITPTFARMVAQRSQQLPSIIRWFSFGRAYRYEQPQKGRSREFFQWEINILGPESPEADAEIIAIAVEYFKELGITSDEVVIYINDRSYFEQILEKNGIDKKYTLQIIQTLDQYLKLSREAFEGKLNFLNPTQLEALKQYITSKGDFKNSEWLTRLFSALGNYDGVLDYVEYSPLVMRGFNYYTRTVFEAWDKKWNDGGLRRSLFGGGRFDNLTEALGGERVPGVGMAPGDVPIQVFLESLNKMPEVKAVVAKVLVTKFNEELSAKSLEICSKLRSSNISCEVWIDSTSKLDKQLKYADQKGIPYVAIIGPDEEEKKQITLKNLDNKTQESLTLDEAISKLRLSE
ncbi:MAG: histidine--tRNA ligase [Candidatus Daviesbacteria bacterium]|nr:histidine--tRNA ligase [Candidatus Daviesbacteria bacterium]